VNRNICAISDEDAAGMNGDLGTNISSLSDYTDTVARLLKTGKFEQLDCLADHARSSKEKFAGGVWKLHIMYDGLTRPVPQPLHATEKDWTIQLERLQRWTNARPKSVTARVALASTYLGYAWTARGNGFADTVSQSGWNLYKQRTATAKEILEDASELSTKCPEWYFVRMRVAESEGRDTAEARTLFDQAVKFEPGYYYYARILAQYLLPKWGGEPGDSEKFTQEVADQIGGGQGDILYFQIASNLVCGCGDDLHLSWARIKKGFEASEKQYGTSMLNLNLIAFLASHYGQLDPVLAEKALTRIGEQWNQETWKTKQEFEATKQWAAGNAPVVAKQDTMEEAAEANMQTPEGPRYRLSFEKQYKEFVRQCVRAEGGSSDKFETLTSVGATGTIEDIKVYWNGPAAICVYQKLHTLQQVKATPFPVPPKAPYWIRLDLDAAEFAPVAAK